MKRHPSTSVSVSLLYRYESILISIGYYRYRPIANRIHSTAVNRGTGLPYVASRLRMRGYRNRARLSVHTVQYPQPAYMPDAMPMAYMIHRIINSYKRINLTPRPSASRRVSREACRVPCAVCGVYNINESRDRRSCPAQKFASRACAAMCAAQLQALAWLRQAARCIPKERERERERESHNLNARPAQSSPSSRLSVRPATRRRLPLSGPLS